MIDLAEHRAWLIASRRLLAESGLPPSARWLRQHSTVSTPLLTALEQAPARAKEEPPCASP